jgi:hypothetical protein
MGIASHANGVISLKTPIFLIDISPVYFFAE